MATARAIMAEDGVAGLYKGIVSQLPCLPCH